jgi:hypothetical protein
MLIQIPRRIEMQLVGDVMGVRPSSFPSKRPGENKMIDMIYLDVYDDTAKLVTCEYRKPEGNGALAVEKRMRIMADVIDVKKLAFGKTGYSLVLSNVREAAAVIVPPPGPVGARPAPPR